MTALRGIDSRLRLARLYLCTDARDRQGDFSEFCEAALAGGVDMIQLRQRGLEPSREVELLHELRRIAQPYQALVVVHESATVAESFGGDVLHLAADGAAASVARPHLHQWARIGRSAHDLDQVRTACDDPDIDYFSVGPVWPTPTEPGHDPVGTELVRAVAEAVPPSDPHSTPWFAVGGVDATSVDRVLEAGARRIVVVRAICDAADPEAAASELKDRLRAAWSADPAMESYVMRAVGP